MPFKEAQILLLRRLKGSAAVDEKDIMDAADWSVEHVDRMLLL